MVGLTAALIGSAVIGAGASIIGGNKAAKAQTTANNAAIAEQRRQYDQGRADLEPWRTTGASALQRLSREYGLDGQPAESQFTTSPGYEFRRDEALKAIERRNASQGILGSGATKKQSARYVDGLASSEYDSYVQRLMGVAGVGQSATNTGVAAGQNSSNNISNLYQQNGNAQASSYANAASSVNGGINNVLQAYLFNQGGGFGGGAQPSARTPPYGGSSGNYGAGLY